MWQKKYLTLVAACIMAAAICGCGKDDEEKPAPPTGPAQQQGSRESAPQTPAPSQTPAQPPASVGGTGPIPSADQLSEMAAKNREALAQMNQGKAVAAVSVSTLKGALPEKLAGMNRTDASAERNQAMGMDITTANARYAGPTDTSLDLTITDVGNLTGPMRMGMAGWAMAEHSRETDTGYEKTGTYSGYKGIEQYDNESKQGSIKVFVADRFMVEVDGSNVTMDTVKQALSQLDLKKIAALTSSSQ